MKTTISDHHAESCASPFVSSFRLSSSLRVRRHVRLDAHDCDHPPPSARYSWTIDASSLLAEPRELELALKEIPLRIEHWQIAVQSTLVALGGQSATRRAALRPAVPARVRCSLVFVYPASESATSRNAV